MYDVIVVGAGHNGLVCACYLARAGLKVRVLERRPIVGGACATEEFHPGFRNSIAAYTVSLLQAQIIDDLQLTAHGLKIVERPLANFLPLGDREYLKLGAGAGADAAELAKFAPRDAERLPAYAATIRRAADVLRSLLLNAPPNIGGGLSDVLAALKLGGRLCKLDLEALRDLVDVFGKSAGDMLDRWFDGDAVKACFGFDSIVGNYASPYHAGTAYVLLHHCFGEVNGRRGVWGHAIGGMGAISQALAAEARRLGVEISCGAAVERIARRKRTAWVAALADGTEVQARTVAANVNPKLLYLKLIDDGLLSGEFLERMRGYRCASGTFRMNVALAELPRFTCLPEAGEHLAAGIIFAPTLGYMERAYAQARERGMSEQPIVELVIPSTLDPTLAPPGKHVASLFCQHFDPKADWASKREEAIGRILDVVERQAPGFRSSIIAATALSPLDLERELGLTGGDIFHGALSLDQLFSARPLLGIAAYRGPVHGLYHCGSGAHPGGGVTGAPGHNCAREIASDFRRRRV
jgi:phytoene dehydrogenase-like protein